MVELINREKCPVPFTEEYFAERVSKLIKEEGFLEGDLIFVFMSDDELLEYNKELLDHDYYTDVITIDQKVGDIVSGEIMISVDRIMENASDLGVEFQKELFRVLFHGVLHLIGYNDKSEDEIKVMRERENFYLSSLSF